MLSLNEPFESSQNPVVADYLGIQLQLHWH